MNTLQQCQQQGHEDLTKNFWPIEPKSGEYGSVNAFLDTYAATVWNAALAAVEEKMPEDRATSLVSPSRHTGTVGTYISGESQIRNTWNQCRKEMFDALTSLKSPEAALELAGEEENTCSCALYSGHKLIGSERLAVCVDCELPIKQP